MKTITASLLFLLGLVAAQAAGKDGFVSIFDGKTLKGWEAIPSTSAPAWTERDGMIVGDGDKGRGYLTYSPDKNVADL